MTKHTLIFSLAYHPHIGGAEVAIREITDRIHDVSFSLITLRMGNHPRKERVGNVTVYRIGFGSSYVSKMLFVPLAALKAKSIYKEAPYDAVWAMMTYMLFPLVFSRMLGVRVPYVVTLQDGDAFAHVFERWFIFPFRPLLRRGFREANAVTALSHYLAEWPKVFGYQGEVTIVPNGADVEAYEMASSLPIGKKEGETWIVTSSRLVDKNAIDDVIRALALLPVSVKFLVLGSGEEEKTLKELARKCNVGDRVVWKGMVPHDVIASYLQACDIFVRPSRTEGFGSAFVEAMAAGLPVIATQEGGIADFLFDEKRNPNKEPTGWAVDRDAPEQIAEAIRDIIEHPEKVEKIKKNAKALAFEKYDWDIIARDMRSKVFGGVLSNHS